MDDFHTRMAEINLRQGKEPIDPFTIQGFGPLDPPAPPPPDTQIPSARQQYGEPVEVLTDGPAAPVPASPLVDVGRRAVLPATPEAPQRPAPPAPPPIPEVELWIANTMASFRNRVVELTPAEKDSVARIVVRALKRDLASVRVGEARVRSRRLPRAGLPSTTPSAAPGSSTSPSPTAPPRPRKPRRPRGSLLARQPGS